MLRKTWTNGQSAGDVPMMSLHSVLKEKNRAPSALPSVDQHVAGKLSELCKLLAVWKIEQKMFQC